MVILGNALESKSEYHICTNHTMKAVRCNCFICGNNIYKAIYHVDGVQRQRLLRQEITQSHTANHLFFQNINPLHDGVWYGTKRLPDHGTN